MTLILYPLAALAEIAGCFAFWAWLKLDRSPLWIAPGVLSLALFAWLLTLVPSDAAGRGSGDPVTIKGLSGIPLKRQDAGLRNFCIYINYGDRLG